MYYIDMPVGTYKYWVGNYQVGIICPSRRKVLLPIHHVSGRPEGGRTGVNNGTADVRLLPEELAVYILKNKLR